jgi:hypothetical protein
MTKAQAITNDIGQNINTQRAILRILVVGSVVLSVVYFYLVGSITFNVIARKTLEANVLDLTSQVNGLEITYLSKVNEADKDYALSNGFVDAPQNIFATRDINHVAIR